MSQIIWSFIGSLIPLLPFCILMRYIFDSARNLIFDIGRW